jgi:hypothetical protein
VVREKGKFVKGHKGMGGRPPRTEEREIITALDKAIPIADVLGKLATAVKNGEDWAIKLYLAYHWHLPTQPVQNEITGDLVLVVKLPDVK